MRDAKLHLMMFLQFLMLPVWFVPLIPYVRTLPNGSAWTLCFGLIMGVGTFSSPLVCMFADRFLNAERVLSLCNFVLAALLGCSFFVRTPMLLLVFLLVAMFVYMPTWSLSATIAMSHVSADAFARVRVFGTLGWVASGAFSLAGPLFPGVKSFDLSPWIFAAGALSALAGAFLAVFLPKTPPQAKGTPLSAVDALGLKALVLFKDRGFATFGLLILAAMVPFQWYITYNPVYLQHSGFQYLTLTQNLGQVGEIGFMLLVPVLVRRLGWRKTLLLGLAVLALRYVCFGCAAAFGWHALDFVGILVHGLVFGILIVGSQMYVDAVAPRALRNQAQGLVNLMTCGLGMFISNALFDAVLGKTVSPSVVSSWVTPFLLALGFTVVLMVLTAILFRPAQSAVRS